MSVYNLDYVSTYSEGETVDPSLSADVSVFNLDRNHSYSENEEVIEQQTEVSSYDYLATTPFLFIEDVGVPFNVSTYENDYFHTAIDLSFEKLEEFTVEWAVDSISATEITDPNKSLVTFLNAPTYKNVSVEWEVLNTSTAQNVVEYSLSPSITGTLNLGFNNPVTGSLEFTALTQVFARPRRTVLVSLKSVTGIGSHNPQVTFLGPSIQGDYFRLFQLNWYAGTQFPLGTSANDQAQKLATAWNTADQNIGSYGSKVLATAVGPTVEFAFQPSITQLPIDSKFDFHQSAGPQLTRSLLFTNDDTRYTYLSDNGGRTGNWAATLGNKSVLTVYIEAHGARPGFVTLFSYDATTRRVTKRSQVTPSYISGLDAKLTEIETRLRARGF